jgi:hypothetical protein
VDGLVKSCASGRSPAPLRLRGPLLTGAHAHQYFRLGTKPDGQRVKVRGCDFYTFQDGKVVRKDSYWKIVE